MDATTIIQRCGGDAVVASATERERNSVFYWRRRNSIPPRYWKTLVDLAKASGQHLTFEDLAAHRAGQATP